MLGRITTGVKLINLKEGVSVASIAKVVEDKTLMPPEEAKEEADESENSDETQQRIIIHMPKLSKITQKYN